jgi:hypothetical protein
MQSVSLNYRVGEDGILNLDVPIGLTNADLEVTVQPITRIIEENVPQGKGWPPSFLKRLLGLAKMTL